MILDVNGNERSRECAKLRVGDIVRVNHNERIPTDLVLLYTTEKSGTVFVKTDQLDGETDWKLRRAIATTQQCGVAGGNIRSLEAFITANPPTNKIYDFVATFTVSEDQESVEPLSLENTLWANTVLASGGFVYGLVTYTGRETRAVMNSENPRSKNGLIDLEVNFLSKILFVLMMVVALAILLMNGVYADWYIFYFRFVLLLSSIIPISLRVNLDLAKIWYSLCIAIDKEIEGTIPRNSTIPEELGRI